MRSDGAGASKLSSLGVSQVGSPFESFPQQFQRFVDWTKTISGMFRSAITHRLQSVQVRYHLAVVWASLPYRIDCCSQIQSLDRCTLPLERRMFFRPASRAKAREAIRRSHLLASRQVFAGLQTSPTRKRRRMAVMTSRLMLTTSCKASLRKRISRFGTRLPTTMSTRG